MGDLSLSKTLELMRGAAFAAGEEILSTYNGPFIADTKSDGSPVTVADKRAEQIILEHLAPARLPVLAEESVAAGNIPDLGSKYFVVDPLDGTREFIKKNGEFTVNIALIENGRPICGIVTAPAFKQGYIGSALGAFEFSINSSGFGEQVPICVRNHGPMDIVASRSHGSELLDELLCQFSLAKSMSVGSSLKFCLVAKGLARLYPRFSPTCEWDTAAGQAVLEAAGGYLLKLECEPMTYGKVSKGFFNPVFVAASDKNLAVSTANKMAQISQKKNPNNIGN